MDDFEIVIKADEDSLDTVRFTIGTWGHSTTVRIDRTTAEGLLIDLKAAIAAADEENQLLQMELDDNPV